MKRIIEQIEAAQRSISRIVAPLNPENSNSALYASQCLDRAKEMLCQLEQQTKERQQEEQDAPKEEQDAPKEE